MSCFAILSLPLPSISTSNLKKYWDQRCLLPQWASLTWYLGIQTPDLMLIQQALCSLGHFLNLFVHHGFSYFSPTLLQCVSCLIFNLWSTGSVNILVFLSLTWQSKTHYSGIFRHGQELKWEGKMQREDRKGEERRHFLWDVSRRPAFQLQPGESLQLGTLTVPDAAIWT